MNRNRHGFDERRALERQAVWKLVQNARGHRHVLGECAVAAVIAARHAEHHAVVAEVDLPLPAEVAFAARHGRVECHAIAHRESFDRAAGALDDAGGLVPHDERRNAPAGGPVVPVDVASADAARPHAHEHFVFANLRRRHVDDVQASYIRTVSSAFIFRSGYLVNLVTAAVALSDHKSCTSRAIRTAASTTPAWPCGTS